MMRTHRRNALRKALPAWGALCAVFFLLALIFSLLQPGPALAQSDEEEWFTVMFQEGGSFECTIGGEDGYLQFDFISYLDPIKIYKDGTAHNEFKLPSEASSMGTTIEGTCSFDGEYNSKTKTLTGKYKSSYSRNDEDFQTEYTETFEGTLEGTLEYRPGEYSGEEIVDTIFTMRGKIRCTGTVELTDNDEDDEDESYSKDARIDYDFVANGNTGPETGTIETGTEDGGGSKIPGPSSWWVWVTTVVAGGIAAGTGLISSIIGAGAGTAPPVPPIPTTGGFPPGPPPTDIAGGSVDPFSRIPARPPDTSSGLEPPPGVSKVDIAIDTVINIAEDITQWEHITNPSDYIKEKTDALGKEIIDTARKETDLPIYEDALKKTAKDIENIINIPENEAYVAWENIKEYIRNNERIQNIKEGLKEGAENISEEVEVLREGMRMTGEDIDRLSKIPGEKIEEGLKKAGEAYDGATEKLMENLGGENIVPDHSKIEEALEKFPELKQRGLAEDIKEALGGETIVPPEPDISKIEEALKKPLEPPGEGQ